MSLDVFSLKGKTAIVTGASQGLGEAIAVGLAEAGADLVLTARNAEKLEDLAGRLSEKGSKCIPVQTDVLNSDDVQNRRYYK